MAKDFISERDFRRTRVTHPGLKGIQATWAEVSGFSAFVQSALAYTAWTRGPVVGFGCS